MGPQGEEGRQLERDAVEEVVDLAQVEAVVVVVLAAVEAETSQILSQVSARSAETRSRERSMAERKWVCSDYA